MKPYFGHFSIFLDFNINFLKIDSINLFVAIHQWKEESLSFPTRYGTSMAYFFRNNISLDNMCRGTDQVFPVTFGDDLDGSTARQSQEGYNQSRIISTSTTTFKCHFSAYVRYCSIPRR